MKRQLWKATVRASYCPPYPCPACTDGVIKIVKNTFLEKETTRSKKWRNHDDWDPEWMDYIFSAAGKCNQEICGQDFFMIGVGGVEPIFDEEYGQALEDTFYPKYCLPMPNIISIPSNCPETVKLNLLKSFELFWRNPEGCANAIRVALEKLMDHLGVQSTSKGNKKPVSLHSKIEIYAKNEPIIGGHLMALKWLTNDGSHGATVHPENLLDAYEVLEHCLEEIIENKSKKIEELAKKISKKHAKSQPK